MTSNEMWAEKRGIEAPVRLDQQRMKRESWATSYWKINFGFLKTRFETLLGEI
jgi:hypothetical protein